MKDLPKPIEPIVVTTVFDDRDGVEKYKGVSVDELLKKPIEETIWLLWTGKLPNEVEREFARMTLVMVADHGPAVAGAYATILATSAGLNLPQAVASGVQMIGPRFGGAAGQAAKEFKEAVEKGESVEQFEQRMKDSGVSVYPGIGHKIFSKSRPDARVQSLRKWAKDKISVTPHLDFGLKLEEELVKKNEKLILNIDGTIGAVLMDLGFPLDGVDGFFVLSRTIGLIAHYIDQKKRGTGLIRLPEELILHK